MLDQLTDNFAVLSDHSLGMRALSPVTVGDAMSIFGFGVAELKLVVIELLVEIHDV